MSFPNYYVFYDWSSVFSNSKNDRKPAEKKFFVRAVNYICGIFAAAVLTLPAFGADTAGIKIDTDFPGGNIIVESINDNVVRVHQEMRDSGGEWFYWAFRVTGAEGKTVRFEFTTRPPLSTRGPAYSRDGGKTWSWLGSLGQPRNRFTFKFRPDDHQVRFSVGIPYNQETLERFCGRFSGNPCLKKEILTASQKNRPVEMIRISDFQSDKKTRIVLTGTHHACEQVALYTIEGIMETALSDTETGKWFRKNTEIFAVPFIDKDGVEDGDQGKGRIPHDHNRDYVQGRYPTVRALMKMISARPSDSRLVMFDFHCPELYDDAPNLHQTLFFTPPFSEKMKKTLARLTPLIAKHQKTGKLHFDAVKGINGMTYGLDLKTQKTCTGWACEQPGIVLAGTLEVPYANIEGVEVTPEHMREFGHSFAEALKEYLSQQ